MPVGLRSFTADIETGRRRDTVLGQVDLRVTAGRLTALLGGPGDGKTMTVYAPTGRLPEVTRTTGEVLVDGGVGDRSVSARAAGDFTRRRRHR